MQSILNYLENKSVLNLDLDYICEAEEKGFSKFTNDFDELKELSPEFYTKKVQKLSAELRTELINFIGDIIGEVPDIDQLFLYNPATTYIKMFPSFNDAITICSKNYPDISVSKTSNSGDYSLTVKIAGKKIIQTGSGSLSRVTTESQELATCLVWNKYVEILKENPKFDKFSKNEIQEIVKDISEFFDSEWIKSFIKQVSGIRLILDKKKLNVTDYKMCRYKEDESTNIGKTYANFVEKYTKSMDKDLTAAQKDNFDPSDVILYDSTKIEDIITALSSCQTKDEYTDNCFTKNLTIGISLKKISGAKEIPSFETFNIKGEVDKIGAVNSVKCSQSGKGYKITCFGNYNFDSANISDPETKEDSVPKEYKKTNKIVLTVRTFGSNRVGVDAIIVNGEKQPSLGKCPARIWRNMILTKTEYEDGYKDEEPISNMKNPTIEECVRKFVNFVNHNTEKTLNDTFIEIIKAAAKEGPGCLPFILLH